MSSLDHDFRYLNHEGRWSGFTLRGLDLRADGSLALASLPSPEPAHADPDAASSTSPSEPVRGTAIAVDGSGNVYFSRPDLHRVDRIDACTGEAAPLPCLFGPGSDPGQLRSPRGLLWLTRRGVLLVCDTGNARVQLVAPEDGQVVEIWSSPLVAPVAAAADRAGNVYIADAGAGTVFKRRSDGEWDARFARAVTDSAALARPCGIAVIDDLHGAGTRVFVLDRARHCVFAFDAQGDPLLDEARAPHAIGRDELDDPISLAASAGSLYVSDVAQGDTTRVLRFQTTSGFPLAGPISGLTSVSAMLARDGRLWIQRGTDRPAPHDEQRTFVEEGTLESPPIDVGRKVAWTSLQVYGPPVPSGTHVELSVRFLDDERTATSEWEVAPPDALHLHLRDVEARYCRIRVRLRGDGASTPVLENIAIRFDQPGYLTHLPAVYGAPGPSREFLVRFLALFESVNGDLDAAIDALPQLFDPASVPAEFLPWLAGWLAVDLDQRWPPEKQRAAILRAYDAYGRRGTVDGLRSAIQFELGVSAVLVEPILQASWWMLPAAHDPCGAQEAPDDGSAGAGSLLGFTTSLAAAEADSAVVGTSTLDRTRILHESDHGVPLFDDVAYSFIANVYRGAVDDPETRAALTRLIEREKPAHTSYRLQSIEPLFRVGMQASVGFDTVVAGPPEATALGSEHGPLQLAGDPPARIGRQSRVGQGMRL